jgi:hypothetical protein
LVDYIKIGPYYRLNYKLVLLYVNLNVIISLLKKGE